MLLTGSGDELCGLLSTLFQAVAYYPPTVGPSAFLVFVYWKFPWRSALCLPPFSGVLRAPPPPPPPRCVFLFSSLFIIHFFCFLFFCRAGGSVCPGGYTGFSQGWLWEYHMLLICSLVSLRNISQAGLELVSGGAGALLFSQCNMVWRSFLWTGVLGCQSFDSS
jgi:hypothetical protein